MAKWIVLALLALSALPDTLTESLRQCSQGCNQAPSHDFKFNIQPGHTYVYNFEATTETSVPGASPTSDHEKSGGDQKPGGQRLHITAQAELSAGPGCDHTMRLVNVEVTGADGQKFHDFSHCEKHPIGFSFNNGLLGDNICIEEGDAPSDVNVKRAVLSLIQVAKIQNSGSASFYETDIFGTCPTDFTFHEEGGLLKVTKYRNLNRCAHREGLRNNFLSSTYGGPSDFQSTPLLQSNLQVEQTLEDHMVVSAISQEDYLFRPFSNGVAGARTTVTSKLTLVQHQPGPAPIVSSGHGSSIIFDTNTVTDPNDPVSAEVVSSRLKKAEKAAVNGLSLDSAQFFRGLISSMKYATSECLMEVYNQVKTGAGYNNKKVAKGIFLDALLQTRTGPSIEIIVDLINSKEVSPSATKLSLLGLSFVQQPTRASLKAVATLLESPSIPAEAFLGAGALVGKYCSEHPCDESVPEYKILVGKLAHKLGKGCKPLSRVHENEMISSLKGLFNTHKLTEEAVEAVMKCAVSNDVPTRIRVAALDTFRGDPCQQKLKKTAMDIMKNRDMDSELRIKAYLVLAECPCDKVSNVVKELMETEPINQVGSFISSHLMSLRTSSNPDRAKAKHYLAGIRPKKRYPQDIRKFSRAFEMSYAFDGLNMGSSAEGNLIFSQKSFVPRSAMVNLTTDLFGHSFNLMEVGVRAENVDHVLESLLGPRGYFNTHSSNEVMTETRDKAQGLYQKVQERFRKTQGGKAGKREKRDVTREMVKAIGKKVGRNVDDEDQSLDIDFHMKLFGSEVSWMNYHGDMHELQPEMLIDKFFNIVDNGVNKAKDFKLDFSPNAALFDTHLVYPTGAGFDLILSAGAHSSVDLKVESQVDIPAIFKSPGNAAVHVKLLPRATVEVNGAMTVNAFSGMLAGLEVIGTVHSSTGVDIHANVLENGNGIDVKLGLPDPKQEFFSVRTQVLSKRRNKGSPPVKAPLEFDGNSKVFQGCFDQLTPVTGLILCGGLEFPWIFSDVALHKPHTAVFPLDSPFKASLNLQKLDEALTHYHFRALYSRKGSHKSSFEMTFDTPNTKQDRTLNLLFECDTETDKVARFNMKTPWNSFSVEAAIVNNDNEQSFSGKYKSDGGEYLAKIGLILQSASGNKKVYTPTMELIVPEKKTKYSSKQPKEKKTKPKWTIEGTVTVEKDESAYKHIYTLDGVNFVTPKDMFGLEGQIGREDQHTYSTDMKLKFDDIKEYISFKGKLHEELSTGSISDFSISTEAEFGISTLPEIGFSAKWDFQRRPDHMENTFDLIHGPDLKSDLSHLHISNLVLYKYESVDSYGISTKNSVTYPVAGLRSKLEGAVSPTSIEYDVELKYDKHNFESELDFKFGKTVQDGYDLKWEVEAFGSGFALNSKREITSPKTSKVEICLELKPGGRKYDINSNLMHSYVGSKEFEFGADTTVKIPGHEIYRINSEVFSNPAILKSYFKLHSGDVCVFDVNAHCDLATEGHCKSAEWKVMVKKYLDGAGHYSSPDGKGVKGDFVFHVLKADRKLKGEYSVSYPGEGMCNSVIDFFWNADKDPSKKLHFESMNKMPYSDNVFESKNKLVFVDKTTRLDAKIIRDGKLTAGSLTGVVDLYLPSTRHISFNWQHKLNFQPSSNGDSQIEISDVFCDKAPSGGQSCLTIKGEINHLNIQSGSYEFVSDVSYVGNNGKDLKFTGSGKNVPKDGKTTFDGKGKFSGTLIDERHLGAEWGGEVSQGVYKFHVVGKVGDDQSLELKASLDTTIDGGKTRAGELHLEGHTKIEGLSNFAVNQKAIVTADSPQNFDWSSSTSFKWDKDQTLIIGGKASSHANKCSAMASVRLPAQSEDYILSTEWSHDAGTPRIEGSIAVMWPQGKQVKLDIQATVPKDSLALHIVAHTPVEGHEVMELLINHRNIKAEHALETDVTVIASPEHKISIHSRLEFGPQRRVLDFTASRQGGPTNKGYIRLEKKGDNIYESELNLDFGGEEKRLAAETSLRFDKVDDFAIHCFLDSSALKVNKWSIDIITKQGGGGKGGVKGGAVGKKIVFTGKKADEVVFQGSTSFSRKEVGNTLTYEGVGSIKMGGETKNANFKLSIITLSMKENGETGLETKVNMVMTSSKGDKHALVGEGKLSNKELRFYNSYCKEGDKCSLIEAYSKLHIQDYDMTHDFAFILDLKNLINLIPVTIKGSTHRTGDFNIDHQMEVQIDKGKSKYSYHLYLKDHEAGASLTLPKRTMAVIGTLHGEGQGKKDGGIGGFSADLTVWLDKERHPELKTTGSLLIDVTLSKETYNFMYEGKVTHPSLGKPIAIRGQALVGGEHTWFDSKTDLDLFDKSDQTVVVCIKLHHEPMQNYGHNVTALLDLKSKGQNLDLEWITHAAYTGRSFGFGSFASYISSENQRKEAGVLLRVSPEDVFLLIKAPSCEILRVDTKLEFTQAKQVINHEMCVFGKRTYVIHLEFKGLNAFKYQTYDKDSPNDQFQIHGTLVWGNAMEVHIERLRGGQKEVLANVHVALNQENIFDIQHTWEQAKIKEYLTDLKADFSHLVEEVKKTSEEMSTDFETEIRALLELLKKCSPNLKPLLDSYYTQLKELKEEILSDPAFSQVVESVKHAITAFNEAFSQTIEKLSYLVDDLMTIWNSLCEKVTVFTDKMMPKLRESVSKIIEVVSKEFEMICHYAVDAFERFLEFMQQFSGEFKALGKIFVQFLQDVARTVGKLINEVKDRYTELSKDAAEHLKALPAYEFLKNMYEEFVRGFPQHASSVIVEVLDAVIETSQTEELREFMVALKTYAVMKVDNVECDDAKELQSLYALFVKAVKSVIALVREAGADIPLDPNYATQMKFPFWFDGSFPQFTSLSYSEFERLPFFFAVRFSPFFLKLDDFPSLSELVKAYWPSIPRGILPPQKAYGMLVAGEHFFTFDHRQYTLSGCSCSYILAQDFEDRNFTVVANIQDRRLQSITLMDPNEIISLNTIDGTVHLNGQPTELPIHHSTIAAWTEYDSVSLKSSYGVAVHCDLHYKELCVVSINGYYFGKTKGLLGTYNNEPYDDFIMPNGKSAPSVDKLANVWKANPSCAPVAAQSHIHEHVKECSDIFAGYSSLRMCFPIVNPAGFRDACDASVAMESCQPCEIATAYVIACRQEGIEVSLPSKCGQCNVLGNPLDLYQSVSLKAPQGKADVILVIEQLPKNKDLFTDLIVPLVTTLTNDLKAYKINDVKFILFGFGGHGQKWPSIYTVNGEIGFDGKGENVKFEPATKEKGNQILEDAPEYMRDYIRRFENIRKLVNVEIGSVNYGETFQLVRDYPFRPGAARAVVAVLHSRCLYSPLPVSSQAVRLFFQKKYYQQSGVSFHVITPLEFTAPSKDEKQMKQVVGADKSSVFILTDAKKKFLEGDSQLKKEIKHERDLCVDFAYATNGAAFSSRNFLDLPRPIFKKQFMNVVSQRVAQSLAPELTEDCTCKLYHGHRPVTQCRVTSRKERESLKAGTKSVKG